MTGPAARQVWRQACGIRCGLLLPPVARFGLLILVNGADDHLFSCIL